MCGSQQDTLSLRYDADLGQLDDPLCCVISLYAFGIMVNFYCNFSAQRYSINLIIGLFLGLF